MSEHQGPETLPSPGAAPVLDTHVHFWDPGGEIDYPWLQEVPPLDRPFLPDDFAAFRPPGTSAIFVEAGRTERHADAEIAWIRQEARRHPWIVGGVAHVRLEDPVSVRDAVRRHADDPFVVGVRRNLQDEPAGFTADPGLRSGVRALGEAGLPFDACVREHQLPELAALAAACPQTVIVLDHLGKPTPAEPRVMLWRQALRRLADHENVVCKLSGLATEVGPSTPRDLVVALLREALHTFGPERCLYGSDWPVLTQATTYEAWSGLVLEALATFPAAAGIAVTRTNAERVYRVRAHPDTDTPLDTTRNAP